MPGRCPAGAPIRLQPNARGGPVAAITDIHSSLSFGVDNLLNSALL